MLCYFHFIRLSFFLRVRNSIHIYAGTAHPRPHIKHTISPVCSNPNEQMETEHGSRQERSRYKTIEWTAYESVHKKYLNFGKCGN